MIRKTSVHKAFSILLKLLVFGATLYYLYFKVISTDKFSGFFIQFQSISSKSLLLILLVFLLMFLNWTIETFKWKILIDRLENISFKRAFIAVWSGLTINNWVPNRMGEFIGRIVFISKENRGKAVSATLTGNMAQLMATLSFGTLCIIHWYDGFDPTTRWLLHIPFAFLILLMFFLYFRIGYVSNWFYKYQKLKRFQKHLSILAEYSSRELMKVLLLSCLRFCTYILQYYLLFKAFGVDVPLSTGIIGIASIFLLQSVMPAITLTEIGIRGALVIFVFEKYVDHYNALLASAYGLWLINIIIPTLFGAIFILLKKNRGKNKAE